MSRRRRWHGSALRKSFGRTERHSSSALPRLPSVAFLSRSPARTALGRAAHQEIAEWYAPRGGRRAGEVEERRDGAAEIGSEHEGEPRLRRHDAGGAKLGRYRSLSHVAIEVKPSGRQLSRCRPRSS